MSLDITRLEDVVIGEEKTIARCPACAENGKDTKGEHLIIYETGKYGCVEYQDDKKHSRRIFELAGRKDGGEKGPIPIKIVRPRCARQKPRTLRTLPSNSFRVE